MINQRVEPQTAQILRILVGGLSLVYPAWKWVEHAYGNRQLVTGLSICAFLARHADTRRVVILQVNRDRRIDKEYRSERGHHEDRGSTDDQARSQLHAAELRHNVLFQKRTGFRTA